MARIPGLDDLKNQDRLLNDIATKLDRIAASSADYRKQVSDAVDASKDLTAQLDTQVKIFQNNLSQGIYSQESVDRIVSLSKQMDELEKKSRKLVGVTENLSKGFDKLGKGLLKLGSSTVTKGIDLLVEGIQRVYDLEERWARVTGDVNQRLGKLSPSMRTFWKESRQAESAIRGLGGELGDGTKMFAEFTAAFNKMDTEGFGKLGIQLAQGFDLGAESSGKFLRTLDNLGFDERKKEASEFMKSVVVGAKTAGVSVNALAKDFAESSNFVARFGKEGAKALTKSAAYLKQFNVSLRDTEKLMDKFDTFDSAAESVAKLNVVFGTSINALDTMLEQDPAKRFEQIRQAMLAQGKTWEKLTYFERKAFTTTTGLTEDQASAMLDVKNAGKSYSQFLSENAKNQRKEADAQKLMQQQLQATAKTLYNFGAAADRITVAIANAIKPFTDLLGLTKSNDKQWKSFSEVMESITRKIIDFFNTLAKNRQWKEFMEKAADVTKRLAGYVADFFSPSKIGRNIDNVINALKTFAKISGAIIAMWGAGKVFGGVQSAVSLVKDIGALRSTFGAGSAARSAVTDAFPAAASSKGVSLAGRGIRKAGTMGLYGAAGAGAGALVGSAFGATTGGGIGGGIGGAIGSLAGPIGAAFGTAVGTAAGIYIEKAIDQTGLADASKRLADAQKSLELADMDLQIQEMKAAGDRQRREKITSTFDKVLERGKKNGIQLTRDEQAALADRLAEMKGLGINVRASDEALKRLADPSTGPIKLSADYIGTLAHASRDYAQTIKDLDEKSRTLLETIANDQALRNAKQTQELDKAEIDRKIKLTEAEIEREKAVEGTAAWITGGNDKRRAAELRLRELQRDRIDVDTRGYKLEEKIIQQKKAMFELDNLREFHAVEYKKALEESGGDAIKLLDRIASMGVAVSEDTKNYVKSQARSTRAVGPSSAPTVTTESPAAPGSGGPKEIVIHNHQHLDGREVTRSTTRVALTQGH